MPSIKVEDSDSENTVQLQETAVEQVTSPVVSQPQQSQSSHGVIKKVLFVGLVALAILLVAGIMWLQQDRKQLKKEVSKLSQNQETGPEDETERLTAEVGQLIELPADEKPTIATVTDIDKVKNQSFFTKAQNGDKVLIYAKDNKAVLYRPSTKKIIEVATINLGNTQGQGTQTETNR
jgi:cell division protein FtsL